MDPKTPIEKGVKFCVCVKEMIPWVMMPLQVVYVDQKSRPKQSSGGGGGEALFGYGSGTLNGHLLVSSHSVSQPYVIDRQCIFQLCFFDIFKCVCHRCFLADCWCCSLIGW